MDAKYDVSWVRIYIYYFHKDNTDKNIRIGIEGQINYLYSKTEYNRIIDLTKYVSYLQLFPVKIGPIITFCINDKFYLDGKISIQPTYSNINISHQPTEMTIANNKIYTWKSNPIMIRSGLGLSARYGLFYFGVEYSYGKSKGNFIYQELILDKEGVTKRSVSTVEFLLGIRLTKKY